MREEKEERRRKEKREAAKPKNIQQKNQSWIKNYLYFKKNTKIQKDEVVVVVLEY